MFSEGFYFHGLMGMPLENDDAMIEHETEDTETVEWIHNLSIDVDQGQELDVNDDYKGAVAENKKKKR
ncbi:unnamed protein product [Sphenostylis stenocarpa]|uniref:Uncharacterized protein n=1 Tax=Sphenostylis stenocarpa TaxID=92480 RepID=A0AA87B7B9_9FABA|nr:unnamed protein product [Sphenostylis stenocarpa]